MEETQAVVEGVVPAVDTMVNEEAGSVPLASSAASVTAAAASTSGLQQLRRVRRARTQYEKLQRAADIVPGEPTPSIEGWVLIFTNLPPSTNTADIQDMLVAFKEGDADYFGTIRSVKIPLDTKCLCLGYALVELETEEGFRRACGELNGSVIPFGAEDGETTPRLLSVSPAFLAEAEDDETAEAGDAEVAPGDKRTRD